MCIADVWYVGERNEHMFWMKLLKWIAIGEMEDYNKSDHRPLYWAVKANQRMEFR